MASVKDKERRTITTRVDSDLHEQIRIEAARRDVTISDLVRDAVRDEVGE